MDVVHAADGLAVDAREHVPAEHDDAAARASSAASWPPGCRRAAAGVPGGTAVDQHPALDRRAAADDAEERRARPRRPSRAPAATVSAVDRDREADADAAEPPPPVAIWELTPITRPAASSSGPPELPGLSAASVWITSSIANPLGAVIRRCSAETTPVVSVRSSPNGLPIATAGSPTCTSEESPSSSGCSSGPRARPPAARGRCRRPCRPRAPSTVRWSENATRTSVEEATTCALVRMWPLSSSTKPEPVETFSCWRGKISNGDCARRDRARADEHHAGRGRGRCRARVRPPARDRRPGAAEVSGACSTTSSSGRRRRRRRRAASPPSRRCRGRQRRAGSQALARSSRVAAGWPSPLNAG